MSAIDELRKFIQSCPEKPGVYLIKDEKGVPIYIGKAKSLKSRLRSHFGPKYHPDFKERKIRSHAKRINFIETQTEAEALLLEASLVKQHKPRYNKELKDDKSYPFLKITSEDFPRLLVVRGRKSDGSIYYGPYTNASLLRQSVSLLRRMFPMRTCHPIPDKVCLMYHIEQCKGPCVDEIQKEEYQQIVKELKLFLDGKRDVLVRHLTKRMNDASSAKDYESAKVFRDQIQALTTISQKRSMENKAVVLMELQRLLRLTKYPKRIEAFDISNFQGNNPVGSMVVFEDGKPKVSDYRKFKIKTVEGINDYQMMREVVRRRYERLLKERKVLPDLILIDGGQGHLSSAKEELDLLNLSDVDVISIAKQKEYIFKPQKSEPYVLPQNSAVLQMLRHLRDEAHRFAITFYRGLHKKNMLASTLDEVPGVGPKKREILLKKYKTISKMEGVSWSEFVTIDGIDEKTARNIEDYLKKG